MLTTHTTHHLPPQHDLLLTVNRRVIDKNHWWRDQWAECCLCLWKDPIFFIHWSHILYTLIPYSLYIDVIMILSLSLTHYVCRQYHDIMDLVIPRHCRNIVAGEATISWSFHADDTHYTSLAATTWFITYGEQKSHRQKPLVTWSVSRVLLMFMKRSHILFNRNLFPWKHDKRYPYWYHYRGLSFMINDFNRHVDNAHISESCRKLIGWWTALLTWKLKLRSTCTFYKQCAIFVWNDANTWDSL